MFREAAYSMLSMQQRMTLHEQCALYYEQTYSRPPSGNPPEFDPASSEFLRALGGGSAPHLVGSSSGFDAPSPDLEPYYSILNHHWMRAEKWSRALHYTMASGALALSVNANHEAVKMFELAAEIIRKPGSHASSSSTNSNGISHSLTQATLMFGGSKSSIIAIPPGLSSASSKGSIIVTSSSVPPLTQQTLKAQESRLLSIHSNLATALYALGRYTRSISHLELALTLLDLPIHVPKHHAGSSSSSSSSTIPGASSTAAAIEREQLIAVSLGLSSGISSGPTMLSGSTAAGHGHVGSSGTPSARSSTSMTGLSNVGHGSLFGSSSSHLNSLASSDPCSPALTVSALHALALSADERDAKEIDLKKLLKTLIKNWESKAAAKGEPTFYQKPLVGDEREKVVMSIRLLEKLCRSSVLSGLMWRSGYAAYLMCILSENLGDIALLALSCSQCAVSLHELGEGWIHLSESFQSRTKDLLAELESVKSSTRQNVLIPTASQSNLPGVPPNLLNSFSSTTGLLSLLRPLDYARLKFQDSLLSAYDGQWNSALSSLVSSRSSFSRLSENKYWREATFVQGLVFYFMSRWNEAYTAFTGLAESAALDGDRHFEAAGEYWKMVLTFQVDGIGMIGEEGEDAGVAQQQDDATAKRLEMIQIMAQDEAQLDDFGNHHPEPSSSAAHSSKDNPSSNVSGSVRPPPSPIDAHTVPFRLLQLVHSYSLTSDPQPFLSVLPSLVKIVGEPPNLVQNFTLFTQVLGMIADILEKSTDAEKRIAEEKKARGKGGKDKAMVDKRPSVEKAKSVPSRGNSSGSLASLPRSSVSTAASSSSANGSPFPSTPPITLLSSASSKKLLLAFEKLLGKFASFSLAFHPAAPWYTLYRGRFAAVSGKETKAIKRWKEAADQARKENQIYVVAWAYYLIGSRTKPNASTKEADLSRSLLMRSAALFRKLGIAFSNQTQFRSIWRFSESGEVGDAAAKVLGMPQGVVTVAAGVANLLSPGGKQRRDSELARNVVGEHARTPLSQTHLGATSALKNPYAPPSRLGSTAGEHGDEPSATSTSRGAPATGTHFQFFERRSSLSSGGTGGGAAGTAGGSAGPHSSLVDRSGGFRRVASVPVHGSAGPSRQGSLFSSAGGLHPHSGVHGHGHVGGVGVGGTSTAQLALAGLDGGRSEADDEDQLAETSNAPAAPPTIGTKYLRRPSMRGSILLAPGTSLAATAAAAANGSNTAARRVSDSTGLASFQQAQQRNRGGSGASAPAGGGKKKNATGVVEEGDEADGEEEEKVDSKVPVFNSVATVPAPAGTAATIAPSSTATTTAVSIPTVHTVNGTRVHRRSASTGFSAALASSAVGRSSFIANGSTLPPSQPDLDRSSSASASKSSLALPTFLDPSDSDHGPGGGGNASDGEGTNERQVPLPRFARRSKTVRNAVASVAAFASGSGGANRAAMTMRDENGTHLSPIGGATSPHSSSGAGADDRTRAASEVSEASLVVASSSAPVTSSIRIIPPTPPTQFHSLAQLKKEAEQLNAIHQPEPNSPNRFSSGASLSPGGGVGIHLKIGRARTPSEAIEAALSDREIVHVDFEDFADVEPERSTEEQAQHHTPDGTRTGSRRPSFAAATP